jgi:hypothetical protein
MGNAREFFSPVGPRPGIKDRQERDAYHDIVDALGITASTSSAKETLKVQNAISLATGRYGGIVATKPATQIKAVSAGSVIGALAVFKSEAEVDGLTFSNTEAGNTDIDELVSLSSSASVMFRNCRFRKRTTASPTFVLVANGATAVFIGCVFEGGPGTGNILSHTGLATNVVLVGCSNKTAGASYGTRVQAPTDQMLSGSTTIALDATTAAVTLTSAYDGKPVLVTAASQPTNAQTKPLSAVISGGVLTITAQAVPGGAGWPVYYLVDGR